MGLSFCIRNLVIFFLKITSPSLSTQSLYSSSEPQFQQCLDPWALPIQYPTTSTLRPSLALSALSTPFGIPLCHCYPLLKHSMPWVPCWAIHSWQNPRAVGSGQQGAPPRSGLPPALPPVRRVAEQSPANRAGRRMLFQRLSHWL